jgi:pyruvate,water dikinase
VYRASRKAESLFGSPQDVEWTFDTEGLQILQSRPVTAKKEDTDTKRVWNLSLRRSFQNLQELREKIEGAILPEMKEEADRTAEKTLVGLTEQELAEEIEARASALEQWTRVYWDDLIPFAHGMRLFGQVYNDAVQPQDPFAFVALLRPERLESTDRNLMILRMAEHLRSRPGIRSRLADRNLDAINDPELQEQVAAYRRQYGNLLGIRTDRNRLDEHLRNLLLEMSDPAKPLNFPEKKIGGRNDTARLESDFLNRFEKNDREQARELLELGRASYRIRDDDNIYLDRFKALLSEAEEEGGRRLQNRGLQVGTDIPAGELVRALRDRAYRPRVSEKKSLRAAGSGINARQMLGQPAGHGIATGRARVITQDEELFSLRKGEILVCDAIDPAMTFVAPLAAGIVERRGGMLIHGAIIAREYGIPCVTGIPAATERIVSGDQVTVDGYLGIVVIESRPEGPGEPAGTLSA